ncbi:hypothetical protein Dsin_019823 [Dipteronia sinensis]|uniref:Uncharacterized protein n=1 Tax=Dipteronia sinensis TaxID=43782 RepID=A0AAE0A8H1_9ROSI|nr:hypothetical protein Dsin_019823 [Dipteronia sinensis]
MASYAFDQNVAKQKLAHMIIMHEYPLSMVEHEAFSEFSTALQPAFKSVSRNSIKKEILQIFDMEKMNIISILDANNCRIALTTDLWTASSQMKGYMAVTAHFIDELWCLQSRILRFIYVPCPHTAETICEALHECVMDWNLDRRLSALTVDNCSTNDKVIEFMLEKLNKNDLWLNGQLYHMRCCAHILNLIVKDGLAVIGDGIEKIRDSVAYWVATPKRKERFVEAARQLNIECKQMLVLDCKTSWNSTYLMLTVASKYKTVFSRLSARDRQYRSVPQEKEWELAYKLEDNFRKFYEVTEMFSDPRYKLKLIGFYFDSLFGKPDSEFHSKRAFNLCRNLVDEYTLKFKVSEGSSSYGESASSSSSSRLAKSMWSPSNTPIKASFEEDTNGEDEELTGFPCNHGISAFLSSNCDHIDYIHNKYKKNDFIKAYAPVIYGINGPRIWPKTNVKPLQCPLFKKQRGRPKKTMNLQYDEVRVEGKTKLKRNYVVVRYIKCKKKRYNKSTCDKRAGGNLDGSETRQGCIQIEGLNQVKDPIRLKVLKQVKEPVRLKVYKQVNEAI